MAPIVQLGQNKGRNNKVFPRQREKPRATPMVWVSRINGSQQDTRVKNEGQCDGGPGFRLRQDAAPRAP